MDRIDEDRAEDRWRVVQLSRGNWCLIRESEYGGQYTTGPTSTSTLDLRDPAMAGSTSVTISA